MAIIQGSAKGADTGFYPTEINQSLRFNDDDSATLTRQFSSTGNGQQCTFSFWTKRTLFNDYQGHGIIYYDNGGSGGSIHFSGAGGGGSSVNDDLVFVNRNATTGYADFVLRTNALFRDPSAWYHIVLVMDTLQATSTERLRLYVNGERYTDFNYGDTVFPAQNYTSTALLAGSSQPHRIGYCNPDGSGTGYLDGYLAETHFTDGTAYDATAFGEFKNGVWVAKEFAGTYGTNGFYLPFRNDYTVEGFSATTWTGNGTANTYMGGIGFSPDLIWIKQRSGANVHQITDSVRGPLKALNSNLTATENTYDSVRSFEADGFTMGTSATTNSSGGSYVAWCWDAGTGSPVSNTDGSITSTVKANPDRGFSIVSYTGTGANATVGHGLSQAPEAVICKERDNANQWHCGFDSLGWNSHIHLDLTNAATSTSTAWNTTAPTSSVVSLGTSAGTNRSAGAMIAYCFHSVSGYSKMGSYTGTGASGNTVTTGFKPAFVMVKNASSADVWTMFDNVRTVGDDQGRILFANNSNAEVNASTLATFTDTGFELDVNDSATNTSGDTYIYMAFADTREAAFWLDDSGNNNDWENNGLTESDISLDSPTNNFATLNPLAKDSGSVYSQGNLRDGPSSIANVYPQTRATMAIPSGKWYAECLAEAVYLNAMGIGILYGQDSSGNPISRRCYLASGNKREDGTDTAYGASYGSGDIVGVAVDMDTGSITYYKNGISQGVAHTGLNTSLDWFCYSQTYTTAPSSVAFWNFGQDSSFAGNKTPQGYTDANGYGDFYYAPPTGYLALCTANLPEPAIGPNSASTSDEHFSTVLWTGNGTSQSITGVGFSPDLVWQKERSDTGWHNLIDRVRGAGYRLFSNTTNAESYASTNLTSFDSDGFSIGNDVDWNQSGQSSVAWNWKANGSGVSNTDGSITSTVSANVDAGFSIVSYHGDGTDGATIGHGLNSKPEMIIAKRRTTTDNWIVATETTGTGALFLNLTNAVDTYNYWGSIPTSSVFTVNRTGHALLNHVSDDYIAYCFHSVEGFSKFGSYTGNGSADGTFVYTGFRPAYVMVKRTDGVNSWIIMDSARDVGNVAINRLFAEVSDAENPYSAGIIDFLSNGFKPRVNWSGNNSSGATYIYMAFAENPFKYSNAR